MVFFLPCLGGLCPPNQDLLFVFFASHILCFVCFNTSRCTISRPSFFCSSTTVYIYDGCLRARIIYNNEVNVCTIAIDVPPCVISRYLLKESFFVDLKTTDLGRKRENAVSTNERLQQEAQAVLDVIENADVAQALRQDKNQNLQYLKDNYDVSFVYAVSTFLTGFFSSRSLPWNKSPPSTTLDTSSIHTETIVTAEPRFFFDSN